MMRFSVSDKRNRAPTPINLTPQIRLEHALVKQTLTESFGLRFVKEVGIIIIVVGWAGYC